jgi:hypothetical protein
MKIVLLTNNPKSPSFIFYSQSFLKLNTESISLEVIDSEAKVNFLDYDVALFMGGSSYNHGSIKSLNPSLYCVIVEPRAKQYNEFSNYNLIITNSLESRIFFSNLQINTFVYPTYPQLNIVKKKSKKNQKLIIGYHGNRNHLEGMFPRITNAIFRLSKEVDIELWAMYDTSIYGESKIINSKKMGFTVKTIPYSDNNYNKYISQCDIGLVPQLERRSFEFISDIFKGMPSKFLLHKFKRIEKLIDNAFAYLMRKMNIHFSPSSRYDYKLRFKEVTNLGRHFIFAQYSIPVISDLTPSSCSFINQSVNGFLAYETDSWYSCLCLLKDESVRKKLGSRLNKDWKKKYSHDILNKSFSAYLLENLGK